MAPAAQRGYIIMASPLLFTSCQGAEVINTDVRSRLFELPSLDKPQLRMTCRNSSRCQRPLSVHRVGQHVAAARFDAA